MNLAGTDLKRHLLLALAGAALFTCESWALGPFSWIYAYGAGLEVIPAHLALSKPGQNFSLWAPFIAGGLDRLSFLGNADPLNVEPLFIKLLPVWAAVGLHRFLQYFVAIFFAERLCSEQFNLDWRWGALAGFIHGAFGYFNFGELFAFPGVPFLLWILNRVTFETRSLWVAPAAGLAFSTLTAFSQSDPYLFVIAVAWNVIVERSYSAASIVRFALFFVALLVGDSPQFVAVISNVAQSHRATWPMETVDRSIDGLFYRQFQFDMFNQDPVLRSFTMAMPGITLVVGFGMALWALSSQATRPDLATTAIWFLRIFAIYAFLSQRWLLVSAQYAISLFMPWIRGIYMGRFYTVSAPFLFACGFTLTAHMIWHRLLLTPLSRRLAVAAVVGLIGFMAIEPKIFLYYPIGIGDWGQQNYKVGALDDLRSSQTEPFRVASVLPLQPAYAYAQGLETVDGWSNLFPAVYRDLWLRCLNPLFLEIPFTQQIFGFGSGRPEDNFILLGADLIVPGTGLLPGEDLQVALKSGFDVERRFNLGILRLLNVKFLLSEYPLKGSGVELVHAPRNWPTFPQSRSRNTGMVEGARPPPVDQLGRVSRYIRPVSNLWGAWKRDRRGKDIFIYALQGAVPRFRFVSSVVIEPNSKTVLDEVAKADPDEAIIEAADAPQLGSQRQFDLGSVLIRQYQPDHIVLDVKLNGEGFLVIANTWNPYWKARIDDKPAELIRTNHAQFGLLIPKDAQRIRLDYEPPYSPARLLASVGLAKADQ